MNKSQLTGSIPAKTLELFDPSEPSFWQRLKFPLRWLLIGTAVLLAVVLFKRYELSSYINPTQIQAFVAPYGHWAPLIFIALFIPIMLLLVIPFSVMAGVGALLFGTAWGILWSVIGGTVGACTVFLATRWVGSSTLEKRQNNPRWANLNQRLEKDGLLYLLLVRALSVVPFNLLNVVTAFTSIKLRDFVIANLVGLIPSAFVYGYGTQVLLDPNTSKTNLLILGAIIVLLVLPPFVFRHYRQTRRKSHRLPNQNLTE